MPGLLEVIIEAGTIETMQAARHEPWETMGLALVIVALILATVATVAVVSERWR